MSEVLQQDERRVLAMYLYDRPQRRVRYQGLLMINKIYISTLILSDNQKVNDIK